MKYFENQNGHTFLKVHIDGGIEFRRALDELDEAGVQFSVKTSYTLEISGLA